jgi:predicted small secreted protein
MDSEHLPPRFRCPKHEPGSVVTPQDALPGSIISAERKAMRKSIITVSLLSLAMLSACNTVRGVGRDVESVGRSVEKTVD